MLRYDYKLEFVKEVRILNNEKNKIIVFDDGELKLDVAVSYENQMVWLNRHQISVLFDRDIKTIGKHINNALKEELCNIPTVAKFATVQEEGKRKVKRKIEYYNLDMILSVGYRVKSNKGILFRKWATTILKEYMIQGYAINESRMSALNKTIQIQSNIIAGMAGLDANDVLKVVEEYTQALALLDDYDHQCVKKPKGNTCIYELSYDECRNLIDHMNFDTDVFGVEKEKGKLNGILAAIKQEVFGVEVYPSLEEKAVHLLYFLIKDHPFADGCKRIAATLFLEFLNKNQALYKQGNKVITDSALVAITLMIAESKPEEKDIMISIVMNFLVYE